MSRETPDETPHADESDAGAARSRDPVRGRLLVRLSGDLTTKARYTRARFVAQLQKALKDALRSEGFGNTVRKTRDRMIAEIDDSSEEATRRAAHAMARVFGVQSVAIVDPVPLPDDPGEAHALVVEAGVERFSERVRGKRFAVRTRRVGNRELLPLDSGAIDRELGSRLVGHSAGVDLANPELRIAIELVPGTASFTTEEVQGPGGLPIGVEGDAVALVSGGFDSVVAAHSIMKRGVAVDFVFCNLGGEEHLLGTLAVTKHLVDRYAYGDRPRFHAIDFDPLTNAIQRHCDTRMWQVVLKRLFLRAAERVAREREAHAIITGDAIGQVSSQTLTNIEAISEAAALPVLRPLVGSNKEEILAIARAIGTFDLSSKVGEYCALVPSKPATAATVAYAREQEERVLSAEPDLLDRSIAERTVLDLRSIDLESRADASLRTEALREGDRLIDLRSKAAYQSWHYPGSLHLEWSEAVQAFPHFDKSQRYVLVCDIGLKSAHLAERMRAQGLEASHFAGGFRALLRFAREQGVETP